MIPINQSPTFQGLSNSLHFIFHLAWQRKRFLISQLKILPDRLRASFVERFARCGKVNCHCHWRMWKMLRFISPHLKLVIIRRVQNDSRFTPRPNATF